MHLLLRTDKEGNAINVYPTPDDTIPLFFTASAYDEIKRRLTQVNGRCIDCGTFARTGELVDAKCSPAVGCGLDSLMNPLREISNSEQRHHAIRTHIDRIVKKYVRGVYKIIGPGSGNKPEAPEVPPTKPDDEWGSW